jgi:hypothetical protein
MCPHCGGIDIQALSTVDQTATAAIAKPSSASAGWLRQSNRRYPHRFF